MNRVYNRTQRATFLTSVALFAFGLLGIIPTSLAAKQSAMALPHSALQGAARQHLRDLAGSYPAKPKISVGRIDPRLRLSPCDEPLTTYLPPGSSSMGNLSVGVRCSSPKPWAIFVPVRVEVVSQVFVTRRALGRGISVTAEDIQLQERDLATLPLGYISDAKLLVGMQLKRNLPAGSVVSPSQVAAPRLIKRGDLITIIAQNHGVAVRVRGKALGDGAAGQKVRAKNLSSSRIIEGVVNGDGSIRVAM